MCAFVLMYFASIIVSTKEQQELRYSVKVI